jgi:hypothetical protein
MTFALALLNSSSRLVLRVGARKFPSLSIILFPQEFM